MRVLPLGELVAVPEEPSIVTSETPDLNTHRSTAREKLLEHVFIADVLQEAWFGHGRTVEVLRAEVDDGGYDLVLACGPSIRWIQLKASQLGGKTTRQPISLRLADKPGACVVWVVFEPLAATRRAGLSYLWFGGAPNDPLPSLGETVAQRPGTKKMRTGHRVLRRGQFESVGTTAELLGRLFGELSSRQRVEPDDR